MSTRRLLRKTLKRLRKDSHYTIMVNIQKLVNNMQTVEVETDTEESYIKYNVCKNAVDGDISAEVERRFRLLEQYKEMANLVITAFDKRFEADEEMHDLAVALLEEILIKTKFDNLFIKVIYDNADSNYAYEKTEMISRRMLENYLM